MRMLQPDGDGFDPSDLFPDHDDLFGSLDAEEQHMHALGSACASAEPSMFGAFAWLLRMMIAELHAATMIAVGDDGQCQCVAVWIQSSCTAMTWFVFSSNPAATYVTCIPFFRALWDMCLVPVHTLGHPRRCVH